MRVCSAYGLVHGRTPRVGVGGGAAIDQRPIVVTDNLPPLQTVLALPCLPFATRLLGRRCCGR